MVKATFCYYNSSFHSVLLIRIILRVLRSFTSSTAVGWETNISRGVEIELLKSCTLRPRFWAQLLADIASTHSVPLPASPLNFRAAVLLQNKIWPTAIEKCYTDTMAKQRPLSRRTIGSVNCRSPPCLSVDRLQLPALAAWQCCANYQGCVLRASFPSRTLADLLLPRSYSSGDVCCFVGIESFWNNAFLLKPCRARASFLWVTGQRDRSLSCSCDSFSLQKAPNVSVCSCF